MIVLAALALATGLSAAEQASQGDPLGEARKAYKALNYDAVPPLVETARRRNKLSSANLVESYQLQAFAYTMMGSPALARESYLRLLAVAPNHQLDAGVSPRFGAEFELVRREFERDGRVSVVDGGLTVPEGTLPNATQRVRVVARDKFQRVASADLQASVEKDGRVVARKQVTATVESRAGETTMTAALPPVRASVCKTPPCALTVRYKLMPRSATGSPVPVTGLPSLGWYDVTLGGPTSSVPATADGETIAETQDPAVEEPVPGPGAARRALRMVALGGFGAWTVWVPLSTVFFAALVPGFTAFILWGNHLTAGASLNGLGFTNVTAFYGSLALLGLFLLSIAISATLTLPVLAAAGAAVADAVWVGW